MTTNRIAIIGGGPGGLMLARLLQVNGVAATVFERDAHADERPQGGSLDIHGDTGQRALRLAGLEAQFAAAARPEDQGDRLYDAAGNLLFDRDGHGDDRPEIDRAALRRILIESLTPGTIRWDAKVEAIEPAGAGHAVTIDGHTDMFDIVVGADGAWSRIRRLLSPVEPAYEGVTMVELGFDTVHDPGVDTLVGGGKMFAIGDNRALIGQRNGFGHIRGYAGLRMNEAEARTLTDAGNDDIREVLRTAFSGWAPALLDMVEQGDVLAVRPMFALPIGFSWASRPGLTLLGDAAHLMSPFSGEGVNLALADAADLAEALLSGQGWAAVEAYETAMIQRAAPSAEGAAQGLQGAFSDTGLQDTLDHYRERVAG